MLGRGDPVDDAAAGVDLLVIATPDDQVRGWPPRSYRLIPRWSSTCRDRSVSTCWSTHPRRGSLHPLVPLPTEATGRDRLRSGITFAVAGDPMTAAVVASLGGRAETVDDPDRAAYHAAASIAANHMVALIGQVERVAASAGLPLDAFSA